MAIDDFRLIHETLSGDRNAFGQLVTRYQHRLFNSLKSMLRSEHDASDAAQDAFLLAYQKLHTFRKDSSFYSWLFRIAYHAAMNNRRKHQQGVQAASLESFPDNFTPADHRESLDPASAMQTCDRVFQIQSALDQLPSEYRDVLILKEMEGLPYEEIAQIVNCPIGTVRSRIHRARMLLRERLTRVVEREQK